MSQIRETISPKSPPIYKGEVHMSKIRETIFQSLPLYKGEVSQINETISPKPFPIKGRSEPDKGDYLSQVSSYIREQ